MEVVKLLERRILARPDRHSRQEYYEAFPFTFSVSLESIRSHPGFPTVLRSDDLIQEWFHRIPTPSWQWAYGILATYGIRPSELAFLNFDDMPILNITDGKTGDRRVYPIYPEWVEIFDLGNPKQPKVQKPGNAANRQFWKYKVPFAPYDLRHAWAIRSMEFGLPIELAAQQMGHSMAIHSETYHRWISDHHHATHIPLVIEQQNN
jgi:integrase